MCYFGVHIFINMFPRSFKKIPFSRSVESWHAYPYGTCRQVEISFLGMPQIAHFQVEKLKSSIPWEGGPPSHTLPPLGRYAPSQRLCPPNVLAHYATGKIMFTITSSENRHPILPSQTLLNWWVYFLNKMWLKVVWHICKHSRSPWDCSGGFWH